MLVLLFSVLGCICVWFLFTFVRLQVLTKRVPNLSGSLPLLGHAYNLLGDRKYLYHYLEKVSEEVNDKGGLVKFWLGPFLFFGVTDPDVALILMNHSACLNKNKLYNMASSWVGDGLITSKASIWKRHRKLLNPTFKQQIVNNFLEVFNRRAQILANSVEDKVGTFDFDIWPIVRDNSLETICQTAIGLPADEGNVTDEEYTKATESMLSIYITRLQNLWMQSEMLYKYTKTKKQEDKSVKILKNMSDKVLKIRKQARLSTPTKTEEPRFKAFLDLLLDLGDDGSFTNKEIREEVDTMIVAGHDTIATSLVFLFVLIGSYPEVQQRVCDELKGVFGDTFRDVTKEDLPKLTYLDAVIKEVLRLYPIAPLVGRTVSEDIKLDNCTIPAGSGIALFIGGVMKSKCWGEDAKSFRPERWLNPATMPSNPAAFAAFSLGRRNCIGKTYAMTSIKTTLAHFLRRYRVTADHTRMDIAFEVISKPITGHHLRIDYRMKKN